MSKLLECNYTYPNPTSRWGSAPHLVSKPGPDGWRFTGDLRLVNKWTIASKFPMPVVEQELEKAQGAHFFGDYDMLHRYWQFLVHPDDQETQTLVFPDGLMSPTHLLHGHFNANSHRQSSLMKYMPPDLKSRLLLWVDDMVIPGKTMSQFVQDSTSLLDLCVRLNITLKPKTCHLYRTKIIWCGRELSADGIK